MQQRSKNPSQRNLLLGSSFHSKDDEGSIINENSIIHAVKDNKKTIIYLPGYLRIKLKNFVKMDLANLDIELNIAVIFNVKYGDSSKDVIKALEENMVFHFQKDEGMAVKEIEENERKLQVTVKKLKQSKEIKYTIRRKINAKVYPDVFWTPFELIHSIITISVKSIKLEQTNETIEFNLMDHPNNFMKLSYDTAEAFGNYSLAWNRMRANYTNQRVNSVDFFYREEQVQKQQAEKKIEEKKMEQKYIAKIKKKPFKTDLQVAFIERFDRQADQKNTDTGLMLTNVTYIQKVNTEDNIKAREEIQKKDNQKLFDASEKQFKPYKYGNFLIPIYKFPSVQILTIFLPLVLLSIINLGIFFQDWDLHGRIAAISVLLIAFVALIPTLRQELPPTNNIVFIESLVYLQTYTCVIALAQSLNVMVQRIMLQPEFDAWIAADAGNSQQNFRRYSLSLENAEFLVALIITCVVNFVIIILILIHKCYWEPKYIIKPLMILEKEEFNSGNWSNKECRQNLQVIKKSSVAIKNFSIIK